MVYSYDKGKDVKTIASVNKDSLLKALAELTEEQKRAIGEYYLPYDYWYTPLVERDHHVNFTDMPEEVVGIRRLVDEYLVTGQAQQMEGPK